MRLAALAAQLGARLIGDGDVEIRGVAHASDARCDAIVPVLTARDRRQLPVLRAGAVLLSVAEAVEWADRMQSPVLAVVAPEQTLSRVLALFAPAAAPPPTIHATAFVDAAARLGVGVAMGAHAVVEAGATIGDDVQISAQAHVGPRATVGKRTQLGVGARLLAGVVVGDDVVIGPGAVVGARGFVFAPGGEDERENHAVPHVASVVIGHRVSIGANTCIDRGLLRDTVIGDGTVIDNLVQVGHDVRIGRNVVVAGQVGLAGFCEVHDGAVVLGQAGVREHVVIGDNSRVGARAGVTHDVKPNAAVAGFPAVPHLQWLRDVAAQQGLWARLRRLASARGPLPTVDGHAEPTE